MMKKLFSFIIIFTIILSGAKFNISALPNCNGVFYNNPTKAKQVALTFDDGPHPRYTPKILSLLKEYNITATFFIIGINAENYPEALKQIASSGCEIANHTFTHNNIRNMGEGEIEKEILRCEQTVYNITGIKTVLFRPPEGACVLQAKNAVHTLDYNMILWSLDTMDWAHTPSNIIANEIISNIKDGDIILMHDYVSSPNTTIDALKIIVPCLLKAGYDFVTVSELIS